MSEFPPNSNAAKQAAPEPREGIRPITSAEAVRRKRGLGRQFKETFIGGDSRGAAEYVFLGVVVPAVRDLLFDAFETGLRAMIYGDGSRGARRGSPTSYADVGRVNYNRISTGPAPAMQPPGQRSLSRQARARHDLSDLVIPNRPEAEDVIDRMFEELSKYGSVSVAVLYELTGIRSSHTDMKWGWTDLRGSKVVPTRRGEGGYLLVLPEPTVLG